MKTKEVIRLLNQQDPSGELEVCVNNHDIHFIERMQAYWDGRLEILIRDESKPGYNIIGAKRTSKGEKVKIHVLSIESCIWDSPDFPVDNSEVNESSRKDYDNADVKTRREAKECEEEIERENQKAGSSRCIEGEKCSIESIDCGITGSKT